MGKVKTFMCIIDNTILTAKLDYKERFGTMIINIWSHSVKRVTRLVINTIETRPVFHVTAKGRTQSIFADTGDPVPPVDAQQAQRDAQHQEDREVGCYKQKNSFHQDKSVSTCKGRA